MFLRKYQGYELPMPIWEMDATIALGILKIESSLVIDADAKD